MSTASAWSGKAAHSVLFVRIASHDEFIHSFSVLILFRDCRSQINYAERERVYKMDPLEKPPFNYAQIIAMAMMDQGRMTLKDICKWIQEHFAYFRCNKNWNVSRNANDARRVQF